ncbi:ferritin-like domain-containing protein [Deinococcus aquatilis]|jgi:hypothetical protein|uniref:ferritin-like domain-containing protein n=1 Tax=Deinococcus aquatilis TaxID=519440 RepID=UPI0003685421|nr:ferritin-like domain-containing protein [Deinococcus aquatilis]
MSNDTTKPANSRRQFLGAAGLMGAGALIAGCAPVIATTPSKPNLDATIFNFALNLEYLEAAFYLAAVGRLGELTAAGGDASKVTLPAGMTGNTVMPGLTGDTLAIVQEIAQDELAHVKVIRAVLGSAAVSQPQLNLSTSFSTAADLASGGAIKGFNPYANALYFLHGAFIFEDVGVTAYKGAARLLVDDKPAGNLENAAGILAVEAYHAGTIRTLLYQQRAVSDPVLTAGLTVAQIVQAISNLRDGVDGTDDRDQGIMGGAGNPDFVSTTAANIVPTDVNGIAYSRTPRQVANIVQLNADAKNMSSSFFPAGLSGDFSAILAL